MDQYIIERLNTINFKLWVFDEELKKIFVVGKIIFNKESNLEKIYTDTMAFIRMPLLLRGTGRYDIKGNDIYDGCILLSHSKSSKGAKGEVWFNPSTAAFGIDWDDKITMGLQYSSEFEVVGHSLIENKSD